MIVSRLYAYRPSILESFKTCTNYLFSQLGVVTFYTTQTRNKLPPFNLLAMPKHILFIC